MKGRIRKTSPAVPPVPAVTTSDADIVGSASAQPDLVGRVRLQLENRRLLKRLGDLQESMAQDLSQARGMQRLLLPSPAEIRRVENAYPVAVASHYEPSLGLGGDIWGIKPIDGRRVKIFSVDFSGHGIGAALNTFRLHSYLIQDGDPIESAAQWLAKLNHFLCSVLPVGQFATMFCGIIDFAAGTLAYAAAAAPSPLIQCRGDGQDFVFIDSAGIPVGITKDATYETHSLEFRPGGILFLYSDALIETPFRPNPVFAAESLRGFLNAWKDGARSQPLQEAVLAELHARSSEPLSDDLTLVTLTHLPGHG